MTNDPRLGLLYLILRCVGVILCVGLCRTAAAILAEMSGQFDKVHTRTLALTHVLWPQAQQYIDRALSFDERHVVAHLARGFFLRSSATSAQADIRATLIQQAIKSYRRASQLEPGNMNSYQGMVECFVYLKQYKQATQAGNAFYPLLLCLGSNCVYVCSLSIEQPRRPTI